VSTHNFQHPTHLIVAPHELAIAHVESIIIGHFCPNKGASCFCHQCRKIKQRQHSQLIVISPEKNYTVDDLDLIFEKTKFALDANDIFFFVLENTHSLTASTANRLLKLLEEPPSGYIFFLLTPTIETMLPTIVSRCLVTNLTSTISSTTTHPLFEQFINSLQYDPLSFESDLKKYQVTERESADLVYALLAVINKKMQEADEQDTVTLMSQRVAFLHDVLRKPPAAGSVDAFWKNIFLNYPRF